ncbi:RNA polymerase sigma factor [Chitinophaga filiformis]|uniref:RNA polymerase sigma factor n=1 Tax=Chitinophaga filiformis TaxID=104663 RepID=A0ABY4HWN7_CHIFI|nr:RNA polymerase sigma factor [Chitinophaga filiformis]UPK67997.1 RNA polymerase sigma factor [Chitinophaga filiformis]
MDQYAIMSEEELAQHVFRRDTAAIGELFTRHRAYFYSIALRELRDEQVAADVVQDVFYSILKKGIGDFDVNRSLRAYVAGCIHNKGLDYVKASERRDKLYRDYESAAEKGDTSLLQLMTEEELDDMVDRQLTNLPREMGRVLALSVKHHLNAREISQLLQKPVTTVNAQLRDGKKKLRPAIVRWLKFYLWYWSLLLAADFYFNKKINFFVGPTTYFLPDSRNQYANDQLTKSNRLQSKHFKNKN